MVRQSVNEKSYAVVDIAFEDENGLPYLPTSVTYSITDQYTGTVIKADTPVTPLAEMRIDITPNENRILDQTNPVEVRCMAIAADIGLGTAQSGVVLWDVNNLSKVT